MFDPRTEHANSHVHVFDPTGHRNDSYDRYRAMNFGAKARKTAQNYENYRNYNGGGVQFRQDNMEDESGFSSPPLWTTSPPRSPDHPRHLSPTSRAQAIARGQWELMEMVKSMPESSYELSLKDLVERPILMESPPQGGGMVEEGNFGNEIGRQKVRVKRQESKKNEKKGNMVRNGSFDNRGLFLKTVFPISFGSKKKKKSVANTWAKVSPKPEGSSDKSSKGVEDWWKKKNSGSTESESNGMSSNNGSSGSSSSSSSSRSRSNSTRRSGCLPCYWPFFISKKSKSGK